MINQGKLKYHSVAIFVKDIEASKKFYSEILELSIELDFGKNVILSNGITLWEINPEHIIPKKLGTASVGSKEVNRFELYFETDCIEHIYENLKTNSVEFLHPIHEEPWGQRTMRFFDPDKHLIEVGEFMEIFVRRMYNNLSIEQISQKSGIPLPKVKELLC